MSYQSSINNCRRSWQRGRKTTARTRWSRRMLTRGRGISRMRRCRSSSVLSSASGPRHRTSAPMGLRTSMLVCSSRISRRPRGVDGGVVGLRSGRAAQGSAGGRSPAPGSPRSVRRSPTLLIYWRWNRQITWGGQANGASAAGGMAASQAAYQGRAVRSVSAFGPDLCLQH